MTTTTNPSTNGSPRKNLAAQLDRLDQILDGLADGLNEAVASAVKQAVSVAVQEAVRGILAEVLTNADLLAKLRGNIGVTTTTDSTPAKITPLTGKSLVAKITSKIATWFGAGWRSVRCACSAVTGKIAKVLSTVKHRWQLVRQFRVPLLTAVVVGAVSGFGAVLRWALRCGAGRLDRWFHHDIDRAGRNLAARRVWPDGHGLRLNRLRSVAEDKRTKR